MPTIKFLPTNAIFEVPENAKVLAVAIKNKINIRYGCGACRCGTCGIAIASDGELNTILAAERELLEKMNLPVDGSIRLACQTRVKRGNATVDLDFQNKYSPDCGIDND